MDTMTRVQILDELVCISHSGSTESQLIGLSVRRETYAEKGQSLYIYIYIYIYIYRERERET